MTSPQTSGPAAGATEPAPDTGLGRPITLSADPIDRAVRLAPKWTVFALIACGLLIAGTLIWAFEGTVTSKVSAPGVYDDNGYILVRGKQAATVEKVMVTTGDEVKSGQTLLKLTDGTTVTAPLDGNISAIFVIDGSQYRAGKGLVGLTQYSTVDSVVALLPSNMTGSVQVGMPVEVAVSSAPSSQYGYMMGTISQISSSPLTTSDIADILDAEPEIVASALGSGPGLLTVVQLKYDASTPTRYQWTVGQGPPFAITENVPVTVNVILSQQRPIDIVFPSLGTGIGFSGWSK